MDGRILKTVIVVLPIKLHAVTYDNLTEADFYTTEQFQWLEQSNGYILRVVHSVCRKHIGYCRISYQQG